MSVSMQESPNTWLKKTYRRAWRAAAPSLADEDAEGETAGQAGKEKEGVVREKAAAADTTSEKQRLKIATQKTRDRQALLKASASDAVDLCLKVESLAVDDAEEVADVGTPDIVAGLSAQVQEERRDKPARTSKLVAPLLDGCRASLSELEALRSMPLSAQMGQRVQVTIAEFSKSIEAAVRSPKPAVRKCEVLGNLKSKIIAAKEELQQLAQQEAEAARRRQQQQEEEEARRKKQEEEAERKRQLEEDQKRQEQQARNDEERKRQEALKQQQQQQQLQQTQQQPSSQPQQQQQQRPAVSAGAQGAGATQQQQAAAAAAAAGAPGTAKDWFEKMTKSMTKWQPQMKEADNDQDLGCIRKGVRDIFNKLQFSQKQLTLYAGFADLMVRLATDASTPLSGEVKGRRLRGALQELRTGQLQAKYQRYDGKFKFLALYVLYAIGHLLVDKAGDARPDPNGVSDPVYKMTYFVHALWRRLAQGGLDRPFKAFVFGAFFTEYPYLSGYLPPMGSGQEMSAYVRSLGYSQEAGPDAFFQRLESTCRCFALLNTMQIGPQPNMFTGPNVLWRACTFIINQPPNQGLKAFFFPTTLGALLMSSGWHLQNVYGAQFLKLLLCAIEQYFPRVVAGLKAADEAGSGGGSSAETRQAKFHLSQLREALQSGMEQPKAFAIPTE